MMLSPLTFTTSLAHPLITVDGKDIIRTTEGKCFFFIISGIVFPQTEKAFCDRHRKLYNSSKFETANNYDAVAFD